MLRLQSNFLDCNIHFYIKVVNLRGRFRGIKGNYEGLQFSLNCQLETKLHHKKMQLLCWTQASASVIFLWNFSAGKSRIYQHELPSTTLKVCFPFLLKLKDLKIWATLFGFGLVFLEQPLTTQLLTTFILIYIWEHKILYLHSFLTFFLSTS